MKDKVRTFNAIFKGVVAISYNNFPTWRNQVQFKSHFHCLFRTSEWANGTIKRLTYWNHLIYFIYIVTTLLSLKWMYFYMICNLHHAGWLPSHCLEDEVWSNKLSSLAKTPLSVIALLLNSHYCFGNFTMWVKLTYSEQGCKRDKETGIERERVRERR